METAMSNCISGYRDSVISPSLLIFQTWQKCTLFQGLYRVSLLTVPHYLDLSVLYESCGLSVACEDTNSFFQHMQYIICEMYPNHTCLYARHLKFLNEIREPCYVWCYRDQHHYKLLTHQDKAGKGRKQHGNFLLPYSGSTDEKQHSDQYPALWLRLLLTYFYIYTLQ